MRSRQRTTTSGMAVTSGRALTMALALLGVLGVSQGAQAQLTVSELELRIRPESAVKTGVIQVTNELDKPIQALVELQDWNRDENGNNRFFPTGKVAGSCGDQLKAFPMSLRIEPHASAPLRISFDGPATSNCWGVVFVQASPPTRPASQQSQITYVIRTGIKVYVEPDNATRTGDVDSVRIVQAARSETDTTRVRSIEVLFRNTGTAHLKPSGAIEIRSADNQVAARLQIEQFPIAPGDARRIVMPLPQLSTGRFVALAILDYAGPEIAAGQIEFEVP